MRCFLIKSYQWTLDVPKDGQQCNDRAFRSRRIEPNTFVLQKSCWAGQRPWTSDTYPQSLDFGFGWTSVILYYENVRVAFKSRAVYKTHFFRLGRQTGHFKRLGEARSPMPPRPVRASALHAPHPKLIGFFTKYFNHRMGPPPLRNGVGPCDLVVSHPSVYSSLRKCSVLPAYEKALVHGRFERATERLWQRHSGARADMEKSDQGVVPTRPGGLDGVWGEEEVAICASNNTARCFPLQETEIGGSSTCLLVTILTFYSSETTALQQTRVLASINIAFKQC